MYSRAVSWQNAVYVRRGGARATAATWGRRKKPLQARRGASVCKEAGRRARRAREGAKVVVWCSWRPPAEPRKYNHRHQTMVQRQQALNV